VDKPVSEVPGRGAGGRRAAAAPAPASPSAASGVEEEGAHLGVHARLRSLDRQREGVDDNECVADNFALHEAHDLHTPRGDAGAPRRGGGGPPVTHPQSGTHKHARLSASGARGTLTLARHAGPSSRQLPARERLGLPAARAEGRAGQGRAGQPDPLRGRTSMLPPDRACIAIFSSASADMRTLHTAVPGGDGGGGGGRAHRGWRSRAARNATSSDRGARACAENALLEVMGVLGPGLLLLHGLLRGRIVFPVGLHLRGRLHAIFQLPPGARCGGLPRHPCQARRWSRWLLRRCRGWAQASRRSSARRRSHAERPATAAARGQSARNLSASQDSDGCGAQPPVSFHKRSPRVAPRRGHQRGSAFAIVRVLQLCQGHCRRVAQRSRRIHRQNGVRLLLELTAGRQTAGQAGGQGCAGEGGQGALPPAPRRQRRMDNIHAPPVRLRRCRPRT